MCINKYFHQYIVKIENNSHWYEVKGIDYINNCVIILYKNRLTPKSFYEIQKVKILGAIQDWG